MSFSVEAMTPEDWNEVRAVYLEGIATGNATFEMTAPDWETWNAARRPDCRLVARTTDGRVIGWAALSPYSKRTVYAGVAEVAVYVSAGARGLGVGKALLSALVAESEKAGIWTLQAGVFPENAASLAAHVSCGFREVGVRERIGCLNGAWRDVVLLERRSPTVGV